MAADDTLRRYIIVTPQLRTLPVNCRSLPEEVERITAGALVFEHSKTTADAPDEVSIKRRARLNRNAKVFIIRSTSRNVSLVLPERAADAETILRAAAAFPQYWIRRIRGNPPTNQTANNPEILADGTTRKLTELGEVQWYLKAMFVHRSEEGKQEEIRKMKEEIQNEDARKGSRRKLKGKKKRTASIHHTDDFGVTSWRDAVPSTSRRDAPSPPTSEMSATSHPTPPQALPLIPTPQPPQFPAPSPIVNDSNAEEFQLAGYQLMIALSNRSLREALAVALNGVPLLEALQAPQSILTHLQSDVLPQEVPIDPAIVSAFERIIRLRRDVTDPTNTDVLALDNGVRSAILRFRELILQRR